MGKVVVITGASAGIGRATARAFARLGWDVGLIARGRDGLEGAKREVEHLGGRAAFVQADVVDPDAVDTAGNWLADDLGPLRVWVNDAMITSYSPFEAMAPDEFKRITDVCYHGQVNGTWTALRHMRPQDRGTIVNVGSGLAYRAIPFQSAYCGAKFAARGFTDALRSELIRDGSRIRLSMVHLPGVNTPQFDVGRNRLPMRPQPAPPVYQPEVAARAIVRAACEAPRELWVGMPVLKLVAGQWAAPAYLDRMLADRGFEGQQSEVPEPGGRPDNLFSPVPGDHGAHGRYDHRAQDSGLIVDPDRMRMAAAGVAAAGMAALAVIAGRRLLAR